MCRVCLLLLLSQSQLHSSGSSPTFRLPRNASHGDCCATAGGSHHDYDSVLHTYPTRSTQRYHDARRDGVKIAVAVMEMRACLVVLFTDWKLKDRSTVEILQNVIELTMEKVLLENWQKRIRSGALSLDIPFGSGRQVSYQSRPETPGAHSIIRTSC